MMFTKLLFCVAAALAVANGQTPVDVNLEALQRVAADTDGCRACRTSVRAFDAVVTQARALDAVLTAGHAYCDAHVAADAEMCKATLTQSLPHAVTLVRKHLFEDYCDIDTCTEKAVHFSLCDTLDKIKSTVDHVFDAMMTLCKDLPAAWSTRCLGFVTKFQQYVDEPIDTVVALLKNLLCPTPTPSTTAAPPSAAASVLQQLNAASPPASCRECHTAIDVVTGILTSPIVEDLLKSVIEKDGCAHITKVPLKVACDAVADLLPKAIDYVTKKFLPKICDKVAGCQSGVQTTFAQCDLFTEAMKDMPSHVAATRAYVCGTLVAADVRADCDAYFVTDAARLHGVATTTAARVALLAGCVDDDSKTTAPSTIDCNACNDGVQIAEYVITSPMVLGSLQATVGRECLKLSAPYSSLCNETVYQSFSMALHDGVSFMDYICPAAMNCPTPKPLPPSAAITFVQPATNPLCTVSQQLYDKMPTTVGALSAYCAQLPAAQRLGCTVLLKDAPNVANAMGRQALVSVADQFKHVVECTPRAAAAVNEAIHWAPVYDTPTPLAPTVVTTAAGPDIKCQACHDGMSLLNYLLTSPFVAGSLQTVLLEQCHKLPAAYVEGCVETINGSIPAILKFIIDMDAHICTDIAHCPSKSTDFTMASNGDASFAQLMQLNDQLCTLVRQINESLPRHVGDMAPVCAVTADPAQCRQLFATDPPAVARMAQGALTDLLPRLGLADCVSPATTSRHMMAIENAAAATASPTPVQCTACKDALVILNTFLSSPLVEGSLKNALDTECTKLGQYADTCKLVVDGALTALVAVIKNQDMRLCTDVLGCAKSADMQGFNVLASFNSNGALCNVFKQISAQMPKIIDEFKPICDQLPQAQQQQCKELFAHEKDKLVEMGRGVLRKLMDMDPFLKNCDITPPNSTAINFEDATPVQCVACADALGAINGLLQSPQVLGSLERVVDEQCRTALPAPYAQACVNTTEAILDTVVHLLVESDPALCTDVLGCTNATTNSGGVCVVVGQIWTKMPEIVAHSEQMCDRIPTSSEKQFCHEIFENYKPLMIKMGRKIIEVLADKYLNCDLNLTAPIKSVAVGAPSPAACTACRDAVALLNTIIDSPLAEGSLKNILERECATLPAPYGDECKTTVDESISAIMKLLNDMDTYICTDALGCPTTPPAPAVGDATTLICTSFQQIYARMPSVIARLSPVVCAALPEPRQPSCRRAFAADQNAHLVEMGRNVLRTLVAMMPYFNCKL